MERLRHDAAWSATLRILGIFNLAEEEKRKAFPMVYVGLKETLATYDRATKALLHRLRPLTTDT